MATLGPHIIIAIILRNWDLTFGIILSCTSQIYNSVVLWVSINLDYIYTQYCLLFRLSQSIWVNYTLQSKFAFVFYFSSSDQVGDAKMEGLLGQRDVMKHFVLIRFDMIDKTPTWNYISGKWNGISRWFVTSVVILTYPWHKKMFHQTNPSPNFPSQESLTFLYQRFERKSQFRDLDIRSYLIIWPSLKPPTFSYMHHVVISLYPLIGL